MHLRRLALPLALVMLLAVTVTPALAHAVLVRSEPEANAALDGPPVQVQLYFSETLEPSFSTAQVLDSTGARVDSGDARVDPSDSAHLTVSVRSLPDGVYTVTWKALSAVDGHVTTGAFPFAVGQVDGVDLAAAGSASRQIRLSLGEVLAKWLMYLAAAALAGGALFRLAVWQPSLRALPDIMPDADDAWRGLAAGALAALGFSNVLALLVQAGQAAGAEFAWPWVPAVGDILFGTRYGALWLSRLVLGLALAGFALRGSARGPRAAALVCSSLFLVTLSLTSHAASEPQPLWPVAADWIHLLAASVWIGGLAHFVTGLWTARALPPGPRTRLTAQLIPRFTVLALASVITLTLTGLYSAFLRVGSFAALLTSLYGRALIAKLFIAAPMVLAGALNLLYVTPRMRRAAELAEGNSRLVAFFTRIVRGEIALGAVLLLAVGVLTSLPPARLAATSPSVNRTGRADDLSLALQIDPGRVGLNTFTLTLTTNGRPLVEAREVRLRFTPGAGGVPPIEAILTQESDGVYIARGAYFSLPARWQVQAVVRRFGKFDAYANFDVDLSGGRAALPWTRVSGGLLLAAAAAHAAGFLRPRGGRRSLVVGGLPAAALALAGLGVLARPLPPRELVNPIPPSAQSSAAGRALYAENCVPCHGETGRGDGPVGLTLNPRPADLTQHAIPGVHSDARLYDWISNGFPDSVMPRFKNRLSDDQRWHLVNFLRALAAQRQSNANP